MVAPIGTRSAGFSASDSQPEAGENKGGKFMTENAFVGGDQVSPRAQEKAGYSVREIAEQYGLSEPFVRLEIKRGNLRAAKLGRRVVVPIDSVEEWVSDGMSL